MPSPSSHLWRWGERVSRQKRLHHDPIVRAVAAILDTGAPTYFSWEGACRAGLRQHLCLVGWPWRRADDRAALIIELALARIGAVRPTWLQGQPEFREDEQRVTCARCGARLKSEHARRWCSDECKTAHWLHRKNTQARLDAETLQLAFETARANGALKCNCERCGALFKIESRHQLSQRFCSRDCARAASQADKISTCRACGAEFRYRERGQLYCSVRCANAERPAVEKICQQCGETYTATNRQRIAGHFCSRKCRDGAYRARERKKGDPHDAERRESKACQEAGREGCC
jgi:hypothetical protein